MARPMNALTIGVDVGGTKCLGVAIDGAAQVVAHHRVTTPADGDAVVDAIAGVVMELEREMGTTEGVGVGVPGLVDRRGVLRFAPNLPGILELAVSDHLQQRLSRPVRVANDASCAVWAEVTAGAARGVSHVLMVTLGTGIGGGLVIDDQLIEGAYGFAGEIGHIAVVPDGLPCPCGQRGCWERYASGSGLARLGQDAAREGRAARVVELAGGEASAIQGEHVTRAAHDGDPDAVGLMEQFGGWLAVGLANLANVLDPACIVIGGGLAECGEALLAPTRGAFSRLLEGVHHRPEIPVVAAALGERAGAIGAALLGRAGTAPASR